MSVVVKRDGHLMLLCKGADNVIYERLAKGQIEIKTKTQEHLNVSYTRFLLKFHIALIIIIIIIHRNLLVRVYEHSV